MDDTATTTSAPEEAAPAPPAPTAAVASSISAEAHAQALASQARAEAELSALKSSLAEGQQAGQAEVHQKALRAAQLKAANAEAVGSRAMEAARAAQRKTLLSGIEKAEYLKLAPEVQLTEDLQDVTEETKASFDAFRADNPNLFKRGGGGGTTPLSGAGQERTGFDAETQRALAMHGIQPGEADKALAVSPYAGVIGYVAEARYKRGD